MTFLPEFVKAPLRLRLERLGARPKRSFGLNGLDSKVCEYLAFRRGFFVEAGANDGIAQSNTAYFERYLGWRGILIEPIPELAMRCRLNRPGAVVEQCALVPFEFSSDAIEMRYCNLMSLVEGARGSAEQDNAHVSAGLQHLAEGEKPYSLRVPARTLTSVLEAHRVARIDFLSLDVEGYEAPVLRGLDFARFSPEYILIETDDSTNVEDALGGRYRLIAQLSHHDRLYRLQ